jgi:hypothetical protein
VTLLQEFSFNEVMETTRSDTSLRRHTVDVTSLLGNEEAVEKLMITAIFDSDESSYKT